MRHRPSGVVCVKAPWVPFTRHTNPIAADFWKFEIAGQRRLDGFPAPVRIRHQMTTTPLIFLREYFGQVLRLELPFTALRIWKTEPES